MPLAPVLGKGKPERRRTGQNGSLRNHERRRWSRIILEGQVELNAAPGELYARGELMQADGVKIRTERPVIRNWIREIFILT